MVKICDDLNELKLIVRCVLVATLEALTIEELWKKVTYLFGGPYSVKLDLFGFNSVHDFLKSIPDIAELRDSEDENSIVNLVSSQLSRHMEILVSFNIQRPKINKNQISHRDLLIPYQTQCAFIRIFSELYTDGLSMCAFESEILHLPIFKPFMDCVEPLLFNLDHIFKKCGNGVLMLNQHILENLNKLCEKDKFSALDIYNIDEFSLESEDQMSYIAEGLEYPLIDILEETIKINIEQLLDEQSNWISESQIPDLYMEKFGSTFNHYRRWGFTRVSQMFSKLPELCCIDFSKIDVKIISKNKLSANVLKTSELSNNNIGTYKSSKLSVKRVSEKYSEESDGVLKKFLRNDTYLQASIDDCFLDDEIKLPSCLQINCLLNVRLNNVHFNLYQTPTLFCQIHGSNEYINLLMEMKKFYLEYQDKFKFNQTLTMVRNTYAFSLGDNWFRGTILRIDPDKVKIMNIDDGLIHHISFDNIRILYKGFSTLPSQALVCHLNGIYSIDKNKLLNLINKDCRILVTEINQHNNSVGIKIKLASTALDEYLNDIWISSGDALADSSSDED
ncbi:uncharacterized protein LOC126896564 [Daktulosphaira vitifoliae]|uniref:uncharacterized protein LOC126896564 n=1 Tax=Daktulosphaira vitifoliae TaxID=58002 RepID=UPI0021A98182|nr:uncharacterized protein LOC126896564 [Daktulosphaira vitifoliae]